MLLVYWIFKNVIWMDTLSCYPKYWRVIYSFIETSLNTKERMIHYRPCTNQDAIIINHFISDEPC